MCNTLLWWTKINQFPQNSLVTIHLDSERKLHKILPPHAIHCLIPRTTVTSLSAPNDTRCKTHPLCVNLGVPFLNAWDNTQVARAMTSVFTRNTRWRHGRSRGETEAREGDYVCPVCPHVFGLLFVFLSLVSCLPSSTQTKHGPGKVCQVSRQWCRTWVNHEGNSRISL